MLYALGQLVKKLPLTLEITALALIVGFALGLAVALIRMYRVRVLCRVADAYVSDVRGTPMLLQFYVIYYGLPMLFDLLAERMNWGVRANIIPSFAFIIIAISFNSGAYMSEVIRSGILAVNAGEIEAGYSIGMSTSQVLKRIILPQSLVVSLPNFCNSIIGLLHGTSIASFFSIAEVTCMARVLAGDNWKYFEAYVAAGIIYWGVAVAIEQGMLLLERTVRARQEKSVLKTS
jgi:L-cystine transport system permease protein